MLQKDNLQLENLQCLFPFKDYNIASSLAESNKQKIS